MSIERTWHNLCVHSENKDDSQWGRTSSTPSCNEVRRSFGSPGWVTCTCFCRTAASQRFWRWGISGHFFNLSVTVNSNMLQCLSQSCSAPLHCQPRCESLSTVRTAGESTVLFFTQQWCKHTLHLPWAQDVDTFGHPERRFFSPAKVLTETFHPWVQEND